MKYKITAPECDKHMVATYENGKLCALEGIHLLGHIWERIAINAPIPLDEKDIPAKLETYEGIVNIEPIPLTKNDAKIAAFCIAYKNHIGRNYRVNRADVSAMRHVQISEELLELYFTNKEWWGKQPKSIRNYANNFNALQQLQVKPKKKAEPVLKFPDGYDPSYEKRLRGKQLSKYWKHLRELGYKAKKSATGKVVDWVKSANLF